MRNDTENIYCQKGNQIIDYISANLHRPLQLDVIANHIYVSQRQLDRIMRSFLNESLSAYVARQRMERAVFYMRMEEMNLTELADKVGYESPQSFSKAFRKQFGTSPKAYMHELQVRLGTYAKDDCNRQIHFQSEICEEDDLELVYTRIISRYGESESYETAWNKLFHFLGEHQALSEKTRFIGMGFDNPSVTNPERCRYYACASVQKKIVPTGTFGTIQLQRGKYAVYTLKGSYSRLQEAYNNIIANFPYTLRHGLGFEEYLNSSRITKEEDLLTKIFIPIK